MDVRSIIKSERKRKPHDDLRAFLYTCLAFVLCLAAIWGLIEYIEYRVRFQLGKM